MKNIEHLTILPKHLKISELSNISKTPAATIRFYIKEKLLPEPIRTSPTMAYYDGEHLRALLKIRELKEDGMSLTAIKELLINASGGFAVREKASTDEIYNSKRGEIVTAAVGLFRKKGYDSTSLDEIIKKAGVGKGTFYQYFKNKEILFFECIDKVFYDIGREEDHILKEKDVMARLWKRALFFARHHRHLIDMLNLVRGASVKDNANFRDKLEIVVHNFVDPIENELKIAVAEKRIRLKDTRLLSYLLTGTMEYMIYYYRDHDGKIDDIFSKTWDIAFTGICPAGECNLSRKSLKTFPVRPGPQGGNTGQKDVEVTEERKENIVAAAVGLFFQKGYAETSIADIANSARISKEVFYIYFKSKDDLFMECADRIFHEMYNHVWQSIKEEKDMLKRIWKRVYAFIESYPKWVIMMNLVRSMSVSDNQVFKNKLLQLLRQMLTPIIREIEQLRREGRFRKDLDSALFAYVLGGMTDFGAYLIHSKTYSRRKVLDYLSQIIDSGIMNPSKMETKTFSDYKL